MHLISNSSAVAIDIAISIMAIALGIMASVAFIRAMIEYEYHRSYQRSELALKSELALLSIVRCKFTSLQYVLYDLWRNKKLNLDIRARLLTSNAED